MCLGSKAGNCSAWGRLWLFSQPQQAEQLGDLFWITQFIPTSHPLSKDGAENKRFCIPWAPGFRLPTNPAPLKSLQPVTTGCHPKALLGLLQEFPMCNSLPSPPFQTELAGGQATPGLGRGHRAKRSVAPSAVGPLSVALPGALFAWWAQPALELCGEESRTTSAWPIWG